MKRIFTFLFLSIFLVSCNKGGGGSESAPEVTNPSLTGETTEDPKDDVVTPTPDPTPTPTPDPTPIPDPTPTPPSTLPTAAYTFDTNLDFVNATSTQLAKFDKAIEMIKAVVATEEFRSRVINHTYNGKKTFVDNGGYTNAQIYQKILDGAEKLQPSKDNQMDMEVEVYYAATSTVGYTYANSKRIWVNTKYFNTNPVSGVAANLFHEWLHKLGFGHASSYSVSRDYSVPYAIGRIISSIGKTL